MNGSCCRLSGLPSSDLMRRRGRRGSGGVLARGLAWTTLALVVVSSNGCGDGREPVEQVRPIRAVTVGDVSVFRGRQFPGRAEALQFADLSFRVGGTLKRLPSRLGERVEAGAVVAELDPRDFQVRVRGAEASLARARAEMSRAEAELERATDAFDRGAVSEIEMVRVREARNVAAATVEAIEAELQSARDDLTDTTLRAPFGGEISARYIENFEDVQPRQRVLRMVDDSRIRFTVFVPEQFMVLLTAVEEIRCEFDAFPGRELIAEVDEIGREADEITRTFPITLVMDQPEGVRILSGMTGRAWVERIRLPDDLPEEFDLPPSAVVEGADGVRSVWVFDESRGVVVRRPVEVGALSPRGIRVRGIRRGEVVATAGAAFLREGQRVRLLGGAAESSLMQSGEKVE